MTRRNGVQHSMAAKALRARLPSSINAGSRCIIISLANVCRFDQGRRRPCFPLYASVKCQYNGPNRIAHIGSSARTMAVLIGSSSSAMTTVRRPRPLLNPRQSGKMKTTYGGRHGILSRPMASSCSRMQSLPVRCRPTLCRHMSCRSTARRLLVVMFDAA